MFEPSESSSASVLRTLLSPASDSDPQASIEHSCFVTPPTLTSSNRALRQGVDTRGDDFLPFMCRPVNDPNSQALAESFSRACQEDDVTDEFIMRCFNPVEGGETHRYLNRKLPAWSDFVIVMVKNT